MSITTRSRLVRYGFSIVSVFLSVGVSFLLQPFFPQGSLLLFVPAVALSAWFGGLGPGLFAGLVSILTTTFFFIFPTGSFLLESITDVIRITIFAFVAVIVSSLSEARRRAVVQMRLTLSSIGEAVISTDRRGCVLTLNKVAERLTGHALEQVKGLPVETVFRIIDEQTRLPVADALRRILDGESVSDSVKSILLLTPNGQEIPIEFSGAPVRDVRGRLAGMVLVFRDVGERRRAEREIRRTTNILTAVLNGAADPIFVKDVEGRFQYVNQVLARNTGMEVGQVIGKRNLDFVAPEAARAADEIDQRIMRTAKPESTEDKFRIGGEVRSFQTVRTPYRDAEGKVAGIIGISRDLTERQRAEEALRTSEERYRQIVETAQEGIWLLDAEGITVFANQATAGMLGCSAQEMPGRSLFDFVFDEDRPAIERRLELRRLGRSQQVDARLRRKDGAELWVLASSSPIRDANGQVAGALTMLTDLTARKRIESEREQLLASERSARVQAEANASRLALLAHASRVLASSLDYERTLAEFTRLVVPQQADWCAVSLLNADGRMQILGLSHADPAKLQSVSELLRSYPLDVESIHAVQEAMQTRRAYIAPEVPENLTTGLSADGKYWQLLQLLAVRSYMVLPLIARERVLGVILLVSAESERRYRPEDAPFMEELAHRAAMAIDSATLYHEVQQINAQLEMRVAERTAQLEAASQELRRLSGHLEGTRERERARIARELHDQLAQYLTAAKITASQLSKKVERGADGAVVLKDIDVVLGTLDESIDSIRTIVSELRPDLLEHFGLEAAIEEQVREFQERTGIEAQFASDIVGLDWSQEHSLALYRVLQESLTNVARHAQATRVDISLKADLEQAKLLLEVRDNGRGISPSEMHKLNRFGLIGMRERVTLLGGTIDIRGAPGIGTTVDVSVPLELDGEAQKLESLIEA